MIYSLLCFYPPFPPSSSTHQTKKSLNQLHIQQRPLSEFFSCFRRRPRRHHHCGRACCHHNHNRSSNNRLFCHSRQSSQSTASLSSSSRVTEHVNVIRGRYDLRVPPSAYVGALRTMTRRYPPVALDLANVPLSAELDALGRGAGAETGAGAGGGARLGLGFLGGRVAATRGVTRAINVDEGGRRLDSGRGFDGEEVEGEEGGREKLEELPAYDKYGGPPGYHEHARGGELGGGGMPVIMTVVSDDVGVVDYEAWIRRQQQQEIRDREEGTVQGRTVQDSGNGVGGEEQEQEGTMIFTGVGAGGGLGGHWRRRVDGGSGEGSGVVEDREGSAGADADAEAEARGGAAEDRTGVEGQETTGAREEREGREDRE
ncbi:hypothetical protein K435DRAFT_971051 [Dendrothele bispora CBS 962.96]|uniref:Uncharacterized protein n=1 Tax=Dendrothele bispora (strain CBS 962.96) TaxID=1314807 RepID=A0A4S8L7J1_DENBC|nr:hypothetical protein K435DRAFT_971051 [Dendrothele bispora CBS 962.96]